MSAIKLGLQYIKSVTGRVKTVTRGLPSDILARFETDKRLVAAVDAAGRNLADWVRHPDVSARRRVVLAPCVVAPSHRHTVALRACGRCGHAPR
jgi:hypothetical protein